MKHTLFAAFALGIAALATPNLTCGQNVVPDAPIRIGGVGPAISGSEPVEMLPKPALTFIVEYYPAEGIVEMEKEFLDKNYEVTLTDGTELEFDSKGNIIEVDASDCKVIPEDVVKAMLPDNVYSELKGKNQTCRIESIKNTAKGVKVEIDDRDYFFAAR